MSSQFAIYALASDLAKVASFIASVGDPYVVFERTKTSSPRILPDLLSSEKLQFAIARKCDFDQLRWQALGDGRDVLDDYRSPAIEIIRSFADGHKMTRGRFFVHPAYLGDSNRKVSKPASFLKWQRAVFSTVKRNLLYEKALAHGAYAGPEARLWLREHEPYDVSPSGVIVFRGVEPK
jgi:hypothetical protein